MNSQTEESMGPGMGKGRGAPVPFGGTTLPVPPSVHPTWTLSKSRSIVFTELSLQPTPPSQRSVGGTESSHSPVMGLLDDRSHLEAI